MFWHVGMYDFEKYERFIADEVSHKANKKQAKKRARKSTKKKPAVPMWLI